MSTTIQEILADTYVDGRAVMIAKRRGDAPPPKVLDGLKPKRPLVAEGLHVFQPAELLTLGVNTIEVNGRVVGYQRDPDMHHARKIALALRDGKPVPVIHVALDGRGRMALVDGQHRAIAAVIARVPLVGVVARMDKQEQAELFFSQRRAKVVDPNVLVLAGAGPFERYIQEAVATSNHPWGEIVSGNRNSKTRIGPNTMYQLLIRYVANRAGTATGNRQLVDDKWDRGLADELAPLVACFGNKQTNPLAFKPGHLKAISEAAMWVFRRHDRHEEDYERWLRHMPLFPFERYVHVRTQQQMTAWLLEHWNKRLTGNRRIVR